MYSTYNKSGNHLRTYVYTYIHIHPPTCTHTHTHTHTQRDSWLHTYILHSHVLPSVQGTALAEGVQVPQNSIAGCHCQHIATVGVQGDCLYRRGVLPHGPQQLPRLCTVRGEKTGVTSPSIMARLGSTLPHKAEVTHVWLHTYIRTYAYCTSLWTVHVRGTHCILWHASGGKPYNSKMHTHSHYRLTHWLCYRLC